MDSSISSLPVIGPSISSQQALITLPPLTAAAASSSFSAAAPTTTRWNYDVFLSFRGEDTRKNFVDHLYTSLIQKGIHVFRDDEKLERGKQISPELLKAIEESRFSIIVFSENYAFSSWCLDELVKIMDCTKENGHIAHPIFYNVNPSNVRNQTGSFAKAFDKHEKDLKINYSITKKRKMGFMENAERLQRWREALSHAANLSGWDSRQRHESELIQDVVKDMFNKLNHALLHVGDDLVGINFHLNEMSIRLSTSSNDVQFVGINGLGGIGKTTIAKALYNKVCYQFESCSYLADVRESSKKQGLASLQKQLLCDILKVKDLGIDNVDRGSYLIKNMLHSKRVLIILDDVDQLDQLEKLAGKHDWFGPGSKVIITTRDEHLLNAHGVDERYKVGLLDRDKSLELFSWKAFKQDHPKEDFRELANDVINYASGLPLALKVLGSHLCTRTKTVWKSVVEKLKIIPNSEIIEVLKISYDGLKDQDVEEIFLDIACFFKGEDKKYVTKILESFGFFTHIGVDVLIERSLISISENNKILMHDLVQEMGRNIVCQKSLKDPGKRSRLWRYDDIRHVLMRNAGTEAVEGIMLDLPRQYESANLVSRRKEEHLTVSAEAFAKMYNLRLLKIHNVHLPQGLSNLPDELRILDWYEYPLKHLPPSFQADKLVELKMRNSRIGKLWNGIKVLENLKFVNLSGCQYLTEFPDITWIPNLEKLTLENCQNLVEVHPSLGLHKKLEFLSLKFSYNLKSFPCMIEMESLKYLNLEYCKKLEKFPEVGRNMERLRIILFGGAIEELPSSIENLIGLEKLQLENCESLVSVPSSICRLKYLKVLCLNGCFKLTKLPEDLGELEYLMEIDVSETAVEQVPPSITLLKRLEYLDFSDCIGTTSLDLRNLMGLQFPSSLRILILQNCNLSEGSIPNDLGCLSSLEILLLSGNNFVSLPASISQLSRLTEINVDDCEWLKALPNLSSSIKYIDANGCISLDRFSNPSTIFKSNYTCLRFINCFKLVDNQYSLTDAVQQIQLQASFGNSNEFKICLPGNVIPSWFTHQEMGSSIDIQLLPNWYNIKLRGFALCIVVDAPIESWDDTHELDCEVKLISDGGEVLLLQSHWNAMYMYKNIMSEHVVLAYISRARLDKSAKCLNGYIQMEVSFNFLTEKDVLPVLEVKKCGICLVYGDDGSDDDDDNDNNCGSDDYDDNENDCGSDDDNDNDCSSDDDDDNDEYF